ncbi:MAG: Holliday junction branch migration protein RuvA, partial [Chitinophagaceae bacterium]
MYAFLYGKYALVTPTLIQINVNGVGYELWISLRTFEQIKDMKEGKLYTYLHVREDQMILFGFFEEGEKDCFRLLLQVSGIGASTARMILSSLSPQE